MQTLDSLARHFKFSVNTPLQRAARDRSRKVILYGSGDEPVTMRYDDGVRSYKTTKPFEGVIPNMERRWRETDSAWVREELGALPDRQPVRDLRRQAAEAGGAGGQDRGLNISRTSPSSRSTSAVQLVPGARRKLTAKQREIAAAHPEGDQRAARLPRQRRPRLPDARPRLGTLSGGESQRIRLASQIGSGLTGVLYVLDEPSIGLHQRDNDRLLETLKRLRDSATRCIVVEHDEEAIRAADYLIDMGPGAGVHGGRVVAAARPSR